MCLVARSSCSFTVERFEGEGIHELDVWCTGMENDRKRMSKFCVDGQRRRGMSTREMKHWSAFGEQRGGKIG